MPGGDRTGPGGMGPMTGRGAGFCAGYPAPGYANTGFGRGFGFGRGRGGGWGRRNWFSASGLPGWQRAGYGQPFYGGGAPYSPAPYPSPSREDELNALKGQAEYLEDSLEGIKRRMEALEAEVRDK